MVKFFSLIITSVPILIYGFYYSYKESYRLRDLRELFKALNILRNEIVYTYKPLPVSFSIVSEKTSDPISLIFSTISNGLTNSADLDFKEIFENSINQTKNLTYLNKQDLAEFISLSKTLNYLDEKSITSTINIFSNYLETEINTLEKIVKKNQKTYQSLTILSSILIIILLL